MAIEIVDLSINSMVIFHSELLNYQRVVMEDMKFNKPWNLGREIMKNMVVFLFSENIGRHLGLSEIGQYPQNADFPTGNMMMNRKILGFAQLFPNISSIFPTFFWYHSHAPTQNRFPGEEEGFDPMGFSLAIDIRWLREASREKPQRSPGFMVKWIH
jgi:hypothetical protein